mmetsp:Transcript_5288/g.23434  ORF Transcript_5288/g.23434 Transcript_5288/m.23434 type:complete len:336 (-) Transcript_5288:137-1144(-)
MNTCTLRKLEHEAPPRLLPRVVLVRLASVLQLSGRRRRRFCRRRRLGLEPRPLLRLLHLAVCADPRGGFLKVQRRLVGQRIPEHVLRNLGADGERIAPLGRELGDIPDVPHARHQDPHVAVQLVRRLLHLDDGAEPVPPGVVHPAEVRCHVVRTHPRREHGLVRGVRGRDRDPDPVRHQRVGGFDTLERAGHLDHDDVRVVLRECDAVLPHLVAGLAPSLHLELLHGVVRQCLLRQLRERRDVALPAVPLEDDRVGGDAREDAGGQPLRPLLLAGGVQKHAEVPGVVHVLVVHVRVIADAAEAPEARTPRNDGSRSESRTGSRDARAARRASTWS